MASGSLARDETTTRIAIHRHRERFSLQKEHGMPEATGALVSIDGADSYAYAVLTADGNVYNWAKPGWEPLPPAGAPLAANLRPLPKHVIGPAKISYEPVPPI